MTLSQECHQLSLHFVEISLQIGKLANWQIAGRDRFALACATSLRSLREFRLGEPAKHHS
jgi:hypothetical protein